MNLKQEYSILSFKKAQHCFRSNLDNNNNGKEILDNNNNSKEIKKINQSVKNKNVRIVENRTHKKSKIWKRKIIVQYIRSVG